MNTPKNIAEVLKPLVEGKIFCDLGCGDGSFAGAVRKYAAKSIGMQWAQDGKDLVASTDKLEEVIVGDYRNLRWPTADVYYWFVFTADIEATLAKHEKGILIIGGTPAKFEHYPEIAKHGIIVDVPTIDHEEPVWRLAFFKK